MRHASLFSGIGGFDLAAQWMGWENVFQVEIDDFCQKVLTKNFPNTKRYGDIKQFDGTEWAGEIDVLTGGFPCQPFSSAGQRKGTKDDRHLWPEMLRVIREIRPTVVVGENVHGLLNWSRGLVFEQMQTDLEIEGYSVQSVILPACSVNAPHKRDRVWIIAHTKNTTDSRRSKQISRTYGRSLWNNLSEFDGANALSVPGGMDWIVNKGGSTLAPVFRRENDGISRGLDEDRRKSLGNAIVPQVAFEIFKAIEYVS